MKNFKRFAIDAAADGASPLARAYPGTRRATDSTSEFLGLPLAAIPIIRGVPPHPRLETLAVSAIDGVIKPVGRSGAHGGEWLVCRRPAAPSLGASGTGRGDVALLMQRIMRSAAGALARLDRDGFTHRAINPFNIFASEDGLELGPFWAAPPAFGQSAVFEPITSAACHPAGRGPGTIADDIYALGVTLLSLFTGEVPLAGLSDAEVVERKLWQGSAAAMMRTATLPTAFAELIGAMISDEPSQRPRPERLEGAVGVLGPNASSRRRINAALPLMVGTREVWTTSQLAWTIATDGEVVLRAMLNGQVESWLRRGLNEIVLAERVESLVRPNGKAAAAPDGPEAEAVFLARATNLLDQDSPITWKGVRFRPDGLPGLLGAMAGADETYRSTITTLLEHGIAGPQSFATRSFAADRPRPWTRFLIARLCYELNPQVSCASAALGGRPCISIEDLLRALEEASEGVDGLPVDSDMSAFIASKQRSPIVHGDLPDGRAQLKALAHFSVELRVRGLENLGRRLASSLLRDIENWPGTTSRERRRTRIEQVSRSGDLAALQDIASDNSELARAQRRQVEAHERILVLRAEQAKLSGAGGLRLAEARRFGREAASLLAITAGATVLLLGFLA